MYVTNQQNPLCFYFCLHF